jgi:hypothetical protein
MYSMQLRCCLITFLLLFTSSAFSQSVNLTPLKNLLCNKWVQDKVEDNGVTIPHDKDAAEFDLIFNDDGSVQQGMSPDGFISGTWTADDKQMTITISDVSVSTSYSLKILRISIDQLIVQYPEGGHLLMMYYHRAAD